MTALEIKILLMRQHLTISALARKRARQLGRPNKFESVRKQLSMCVNQERLYPDHQLFLADELGVPIEQLFGSSQKAA